MSDVKKFTGYLAADGSTHNTQGQAIAHSKEVKTKKALADLADDMVVYAERMHPDQQEPVSLNTWLYDNREAVLAALQQEVLLRKKRTPKVKAPTPTDTATV